MRRLRLSGNHGHCLCGVAVVVVLGITVPPAIAQPIPGDVARDVLRIQERQQQQQRERTEQFERSRDRPPSGAEVQGEEPEDSSSEGCANIREVRLVGITRYSPDEFTAVVAPLKGTCVTISAIDGALRVITNRYVDDGYVTSRSVVGPQDLKSGVLTITVVEGRVGKVKGNRDKAYGADELGVAFPGVGGKVLNLRALEQGVDQLARMGKAGPSIDIAPGESPGTSTVLVARKPLSGWLRPSLAFNNDGSPSTGRLLGTATVDVDSPFGLADVWSLYYQRDADSQAERGNHAYGAFVSVPYGWWTLSLSGGVSGYHSVLEGNGLSFATRGKSWNASATLDRMVYRDAKTKFSVSAGLALTDTQNFIQGIKLRTGSYRIVTGRLEARLQKRMGKSVVTLSGGYERGLAIVGAHTVDTGPGGATGEFNLVDATVTAQTPFTVGPTKLTNSVMVHGQWGFDNLFPAQRFSLGGSSTVRGFQDDGISGRTGVAFREQVGFGIVDLARDKPGLETSLSGFLAYDLGAIRAVAADPYERGLLQSMSAGLRAQNRHIQGEFVVSVPISAPAFVRHDTVLVNATIRILL